MEIYLIRHTRPEVSKDLIYGQMNVPLSQDFEEEVGKILAQLPDWVDMLFTSPLERCKVMAERIPARQMFVDERLKELHFGEWEGHYWSEIPETELNSWMQDFVNQPPPSGETLLDMQKRVLAFWEENQDSFKNKKIVIVTHAGVIRVLRAYWQAIPLHRIFDISVAYGEVYKHTF